MRLKKQFLHLYCNSNKKGFLTRNKIEITAMAFNDFSDRGKPDSMIRGCALSGEECFSLLQGQTVVSVFNLQKVHIASGFACNENAVHPCFWRLHASTALSKRLPSTVHSSTSVSGI